MLSQKKAWVVRKTHRYLGLIIGIQFLAWTISGLYFSWTNIDEIHGDHFRKQLPPTFVYENLISVLLKFNLFKNNANSLIESFNPATVPFIPSGERMTVPLIFFLKQNSLNSFLNFMNLDLIFLNS